ncbi:uncharacterized protein SCHCODRAFT_02604797 [Schizophyllum commune H4-8]|uniref:uncharacterized protein n=1 Tax=Schizophyllum commune (strain H4-8 / FGSC 9210) TaxID=578458 RepID=UPI00215F76EA|nr:uncharacterized protein SCHCODRAFT_02604797 [Schizophyllum commune H4-8]KAI5899312.1 hypothetical protein SCHCODRAFT_02604797 [Schizophyllum commune H4-8]
MAPTALDLTLGMLFSSLVLSSVLYGCSLLQGWHYYRVYARKDSWVYKGLVIFILVFDTVQQGMFASSVYWYCVTNHGNSLALGQLEGTLAYQVLFVGLLAFVVQLFYCHRVYRLSHGNYYVTALLIASAISAFTCTFVFSVRCAQMSTFAELPAIKNINIAINITSAATDVLISISMIFCLQQSKTGFKRSNDVLNRLIVFTFNTGLPTSFTALWCCIAINVWPDTFIYMLTFFLEGRLFTNCLMVTLNSREHIQQSLAGGHSDSYALSSRDRSGPRLQGTGASTGAIAVRIDTSQQMDGLDDYKQHPSESQFKS